MTRFTRRALLAASAFVAVGPRTVRAGTPTFRVGYQKYGNLARLKGSGQLEERLEPLGMRVEWTQFVSGPPLVDALASGAIDVGSTGETPPIFAQAAGASIVYLASEPPAPKGEAILVRQESPIHTLADLRGKTVAFNKGSNVHYLFIKALEKAGLAMSDVMPIYMAPNEGRAAFENGGVDAWAIWDPYLADAQANVGTRTLVDGSGLVANHQFYLASRRVSDPALLAAFREAVARIDRRTAFDPVRTAELMSPGLGLPIPVVVKAVGRQAWNIQPMDTKLVADQQQLADIFFKLGLIPKAIKISDALA